jgi:O-antigen ligase
MPGVDVRQKEKMSPRSRSSKASKAFVREIGGLHFLFWAFLIVAVGRAGDLIPGLASVHLEKVVVALALIPLVKAWKQLPRLETSTKPLARTALCLVCLAVVLAPLSIWPGATRAFLLKFIPVLITAFVLAFKVSDSWRAVKGSLLALVISGLILSVSAVSGYHGGRADAADSMYDPNDLAYVLVAVLPLAFGFVLCASSLRKRLIYIGIALCIAVAALLTGSRGGLLALGLLLVAMVLLPVRAPRTSTVAQGISLGKRMLVILLCVAIAPLVWSHLPNSVTARFATLTHPKAGYNWDPHDVTGRREIWKRGIIALERNPLGYGIGAYPMVDLRFGGRFMAPHNSFLEIAVELGVLGFVLFVRMYMLAWRALRRVRRELAGRDSLSKEGQEQIIFSKLIQFSLMATVVAGFFLSKAYPVELWVMFGLTIAISGVVARSVARQGSP